MALSADLGFGTKLLMPQVPYRGEMIRADAADVGGTSERKM